MKKIKEFRPLIVLIKEEKSKILFASLILFFVELADTLTGYLNGQFVENITKSNLKLALIYLGIYFFINIFFAAFLYNKGRSLLRESENRISRRLGFDTYKKALDLPAYAYEKTSSGEIINRITNDADTLSYMFGNLIQTFSSLINAVIVIVYVFINSYIIGLEILFFMFLIYLVFKKYNKQMININKERKKSQDRFSSLVNESIRGIREIKTLGVKKNLISDAKVINKSILNNSNDEIRLNKKVRTINKIVRSSLEATVFVTCILLFYYGKTPLSFLIAMTYYVYRFMWVIEEISDLNELYQKLFVSLNRVNEILDNKLYKDETFGDKEINNIKGEILFRNVKFGYPGERIIFDNFCLKIEPYKKIALVGASGQGKSTLFNLLTRVFDPIKGEILIDNVNLKDLSEKELRHQISIIRQEPFIFNRIILNNFKMINKNIKLEEVRKYTKMAYLDDYIMSLPLKYNTILGEGGVNLSGGQKQRLSIARTLAKKSKIILFDEATSALDNNSQDYIKKSIDNLVKKHTVVIVAHRLSTIIDADVIHVVDKGKIVASGTHEKLLKTSKIYKKLYENESFE